MAVSLENDRRLDPAVDALGRVIGPVDDTPTGEALRGTWIGHALHPAMTDLPLGLWTAASVLDLVGGQAARPAAQRLLGLGVLSATPTAATGLAEWAKADRAGQRVGVAHADLNAVGIGLYAASWSARRRQRHVLGAALALAGAGAVGASGYLGGHLTTVQKIGSTHPALAPEGTRQEASDGAGRADSIASALQRKGAAMASKVTGDDVVSAVAAQHARITMMMSRIESTPTESRRDALHELLAYLAGHEAVEEELVHPLIPRVGDHPLGLERASEEAGIGEQIVRLEQLDMGSPSFDMQFRLFKEAVDHHAKAEELQELPQLAPDLREHDAALIVEALHAHEAQTQSRVGTFSEMLTVARAQVRDLASDREGSGR